MPMAEEHAELTLRDYAEVLWRRKWLIAAAVAVVAITALIASLAQTPRYRATAEVLVRQGPSSSMIDQQGQAPAGAAAQRTLENELRLAQSRTVETAAVEALGFEPDVEISADVDADILSISATSTDAEDAAAIADRYAEVFVAERRQFLVDEYIDAASTIQEQVEELEVQIGDLRAERDAAIAAVPFDAPDRDAQISAINQQYDGRISPLDAERARLVQLISNLDLSANLAQGGGAQIISSAEVPDGPYEPTTRRNLALAIVVGAILGVGAAFLVEYLDRSLRAEDDLEAAAGLPSLAVIPELTGWRKGDHPHVISREEPHSPSAEAYRGLRTSVQFLGIDKTIRLVQLTSPKPGDGKTTTAANLAVACARAGQRVVLLDCDLRKPRIHDYFDLSNNTGFTSVLLGDATLDEVAQRVEGETGLVVITSGPVPPDPSELLSGKRARSLLANLREQVDLVIVDSPPVLAVSDPLVVSSVADGVILVASVGNADRDQVARAVDSLRQVDAPLLGTVLNRQSPKSSGRYGYGAYGTYGSYTTPRPAASPNGSDRGAKLHFDAVEEAPSEKRRFIRR